MKRIFILSLLAQCFPAEAAGRQARTDAFAAAFEAVASLSAEQTSAPILPSPLAGHSVELINNGTDHHLLSFYRGPEMVAVHNWPWRRGTVVVPDGDYELAVLSPAATIRPYRGKAAFKRGVRVSEYVIQTTSGKNDAARTALSSLASGDYKLLYAPAALRALAVEPRTGLPVAKRAP
ncbi:MAG: hypothetical protein HY736_10180 [Verrucomicrobia bacterium]|nr:hypothetical protein [Verrucomicrobiota bacterium]